MRFKWNTSQFARTFTTPYDFSFIRILVIHNTYCDRCSYLKNNYFVKYYVIRKSRPLAQIKYARQETR